MFCIEGVWYLIDGSKIKYVKVDDTLLEKVSVNSSRKATYGDFTFTFDSEWKNVTVTRHYTSEIQDKVSSESCDYDSASVTIGANSTFDLYFANVV